MHQRMAMIRDAYEREDGDVSSAVEGGGIQQTSNALISERNNPYSNVATLMNDNKRSNFLEI